MNKLILGVIMLFAVTITQAQKNFYQAIEANGATATYEGFGGMTARGDGTYSFDRKKATINLTVKKIPTGQPVGFDAKSLSEGYRDFSETEISDYGRVDNYPNVMSIKHSRTNDGYMMIDDLLFAIDNIPDNGIQKMPHITAIYVMVKDRAESSKQEEETGKKKKKKKIGSLLNKAKSKLEGVGRTPTYKYISSVNIDKLFNDYVAAMKKKQASPITAKDRADIAQIKRARAAGAEEIKMYNDSIKGTPEYKKLKAHQARMAQMDKEESTQVVTIINKTGGDIYIYREGFRNGTRIYNNSSTKVDCSYNYTYKSDSNASGSGTSCYSANSGCSRSVTVN